MKFENPIMNISMFEVENVVTVSGAAEPQVPTANELAAQYEQQGYTKLTVTF